MKQIYFYMAAFFCCTLSANSHVLSTASSNEHITTVFDYQYIPVSMHKSIPVPDDLNAKVYSNPTTDNCRVQGATNTEPINPFKVGIIPEVFCFSNQ